MKKAYLILGFLVTGLLFLASCKKKTDENGNPPASEDVVTSCTDVNLFSINLQ